MSLVSEALKKAQNEAAQREAIEKGLPAPLLATHPYRAPRGAPRAAVWGLAAAAVLLLATAGSLWFGAQGAPPEDERLPVKGENGSARAPDVAPVTALPAPAQAAATSAPSEVPPGRAASAVPSTPPSEGAEPHEKGTPGSPIPSSVEASGSPSTAGSSAARSGAARPSAPQARGEGEEQTFVRVAQLADGGQIHLGGIAWSQTAPLAYVNGRLVGVGEAVSGLTVERIERDRVVLSGPNGRMVVSLR